MTRSSRPIKGQYPEQFTGRLDQDFVRALADNFPTLIDEATRRVPPRTDIGANLPALRNHSRLLAHQHTISESIKDFWNSPEFSWLPELLSLLHSCSTRVKLTLVSLNLDNIVCNIKQLTDMKLIPNLDVNIRLVFESSASDESDNEGRTSRRATKKPKRGKWCRSPKRETQSKKRKRPAKTT